METTEQTYTMYFIWINFSSNTPKVTQSIHNKSTLSILFRSPTEVKCPAMKATRQAYTKNFV